MAATTLRREEGYGLVLAIAAHVGLAAFLLWRPPGDARILPPERMTVTISDDVGLTSTSPEPNADAAPDFAPTAGEAQPMAEPEPAPQQRVEPEPRPVPRPVARPEPRPVPKPTMRPQPRPTARPVQPASKAAPKAAPKTAQSAQRPTTQPDGASRIGADFLKGVSGAQSTGKSPNQSAAATGQLRASFGQAVLREVRPNWQGRVPQGVGTEKLVTILAIELNRDGTLAGAPRLVRQEGVDDENRPQAQRHVEAAIRAVQLSAPFALPADQYDLWKNLPPLRFRKNL